MLPGPVIDNDELAKILSVDEDGDLPGFQAVRVSGLYRVRDGGKGMRDRLVDICRHVSEAIEDGVRILVLSDRDSTADLAPIPSLLLTAVVHQHLIREQTRTQVALVVESGDCREVHHVATLIGYGAAAVNPYLAFEGVEDLILTGALPGIDPHKAVRNYVKALAKGVLKIMSKMGISTVSSYCGAQVFEAVGLDRAMVDRYFTGTTSQIGGIGLNEIADEVAQRHSRAYPANEAERAHRRLEVGGEYQYRREGEVHLFNPETVFLLQHATRTKQYDVFKQYTSTVDGLARDAGSLRGLFDFDLTEREPVDISEVEPASEIVKRFATGAMSYGSISAEAHETLAIAMNRLGAKSNTGEGGEDVERLYDPARRSAVKQVASGRFGVTSEYLVNADDLQIKMAQGAKPGEGGQLPGNKVWPWIAKTRHATPGVGLISPPPHHDIYSIEDLAQLVYDLKNVNPAARVHVKLVAEVGVGTVAAGVAKTKADVILISGHDGGTGASPLNSLKHAGSPWELGLAETQQTLLANGLRDRVTVQVDGQLKTGRDVIIAALLGAEEFGFATAPLIVEGCVMMRVCHLDTCPVGIATQNPTLRARFTGQPEFVENFFLFLAEEVRELLAQLGFRTMDEAVGHVELLDTVPAIEHWKARGLDLAPVLALPDVAPDGALHKVRDQDHGLAKALDNELLRAAAPALVDGSPVRYATSVRNEHRSVGAMLGGEVTRRFGGGRAARRHHRDHPARHRRAVVRGVPAARGDAAPVRRRQRLRRQGAVRWPARGPAGRDRAVRGRGADHRRQHHPLWSDRRRAVPARPGRRAVRGAQLRRRRGRRGRRRPRLRVHDRRHCGGARPDRAQLRGRHVRRHRLRLAAAPGAGQPGTGRPGAGGPRRRGGAARPGRASTSRRPARRSPNGCWPTGSGRRGVHRRGAARLPAGRAGHPGRRGRRSRHRRRRDGGAVRSPCAAALPLEAVNA